MREFNLDLLIGKDVIVNCKTIEEEQEFLKYLKDKGFKWCSGIEIFSHNYYNYKEYDKDTCFDLTKNGLQYSPVDYYKSEDFKILSLNDLVIKPKNNFKDYGFEADFEGEICFQSESYYVYVGYIVDDGKKLPRYWNKNLTCFNPLTTNFECAELTNNNHKYNLKPIKKEWYENADNFPCIVMQINCIDDRELDCGHIIFRNIDDFNRFGGDYRHLTKEEVLALLVKE